MGGRVNIEVTFKCSMTADPDNWPLYHYPFEYQNIPDPQERLKAMIEYDLSQPGEVMLFLEGTEDAELVKVEVANSNSED